MADGRIRLSNFDAQMIKVFGQILDKAAMSTCRRSMCLESESKGKHTCSCAPYTRFTSVKLKWTNELISHANKKMVLAIYVYMYAYAWLLVLA